MNRASNLAAPVTITETRTPPSTPALAVLGTSSFGATTPVTISAAGVVQIASAASTALAVTGGASFTGASKFGDVTVQQATQLNGGLTVQGTTTLKNDLTVRQMVTMQNNLDVFGTANFWTRVIILSSADNALAVNGGGAFAGILTTNIGFSAKPFVAILPTGADVTPPAGKSCSCPWIQQWRELLLSVFHCELELLLLLLIACSRSHVRIQAWK